MFAFLSIFSVLVSFLIFHVSAQSPVPTNLIPTVLNLNSGWSLLPFNMTKSPWSPNLFKTSSPVPFVVLYSDAYCPGKMVSIYVNGTFMMNSTTVPQQNGTCSPRINLPMGTFALPDIYSHARLTLPQGIHDISIKVIQNDPQTPSGLMYIRAYISPKFACNQHQN